jgi:hypothetical protein
MFAKMRLSHYHNKRGLSARATIAALEEKAIEFLPRGGSKTAGLQSFNG